MPADLCRSDLLSLVEWAHAPPPIRARIADPMTAEEIPRVSLPSEVSTRGTEVARQASACAQGGPSRKGSPRLAVGELLGDRYRIEREIGEGGMGVVYLATDEQVPGERFAIKVLREELQPAALMLLREEVSRTRKLSHQNIVDMHSVNVDGQRLYVLMEYLEGKSLNMLLDEELGRGIPFSHAWPIIEDVGAALSNAHDHNVVHSDLKPGNVFLTVSGRTKLLDFGIARVSRGPLLHASIGARALTPVYASCELLEGKEADRRDDIYSFACLIYELLCGERPFGIQTALEARAASAQMPPLAVLGLEQNTALSKALTFDREARTASVELLLEGLTANPTNRSQSALDRPRASDHSLQEIRRHKSPYRGLTAMTVDDYEYFFGRERETAEVLCALATTQNKLVVLLGNSGVGKSSLVQAGVIAALQRQMWPKGLTSRDWPAPLHDSHEWCFVTFRPGAEPVRSL